MSARLILVSVDGLRPSQYLAGPARPRSLVRWAREGAFAARVEPVYPSVTFTNHASLATGAWPERHGLCTNTLWDPGRVARWRAGESQDWAFDAAAVRATPIWEAAERAGIPAALLFWPSTRGARARWVLPEVFPVGGTRRRSRWELVRDAATPGLARMIEGTPGFSAPSDHPGADRVACEAALALLALPSPPGLLLLHLVQLDHASHEHGTGSLRARQALRATEGHLARIFEAAGRLEPEATVMVFGDHGFRDFDRRIHVHTLFVAEGWLKERRGRIVEWRAVAHTNCCMAPVHVRDPSDEAAVTEMLRRHAPGLYRVVTREELRSLRTLPDAACAIEALPGFSLGQNFSGPLVERLASPHGEHGYLPSVEGMETGFLARGPGIPAGLELGSIRLVDIAPTAARLLGVRLPESQGVARTLRPIGQVRLSAKPA